MRAGERSKRLARHFRLADEERTACGRPARGLVTYRIAESATCRACIKSLRERGLLPAEPASRPGPARLAARFRL